MSEDGDGAKRSPEATTHNEASGVSRSLMQVGSITGPVVVNGELPPVPARPESAPSVEALYAENARQLAPAKRWIGMVTDPASRAYAAFPAV